MNKYPHDCGDLYDDDQAQKPECECLTWACTCGTEIICREHEQYLLAPKPDASPRVRWVTKHIVGDSTGGKQRWAFDKWFENGNPDPLEPFIEKSAYDAALEQVAGAYEKYRLIKKANNELSRNDHVDFGRLIEERDALKARVAEMEALVKESCADNSAFNTVCIELAAASKTIKALRHEMRMQGGAVEREAKAQARIKDCEERMENTNGLINQMVEREQKLVSAGSALIDAINGNLDLIPLHHLSKMTGLRGAIEVFGDLIEADKGEA